MSYYTPYLSVAKNDISEGVKTNMDILKESEFPTVSRKNSYSGGKDIAEAFSKGYPFYKIALGGQMGCREQIVRALISGAEDLAKISNVAPYYYPMASVVINSDWGYTNTIDGEYVISLLKFNKTFFSKIPALPYCIVFSEEKQPIFSARLETGMFQNIPYKMSFFLWIFRNKPLLDSCLKAFEGRTLTSLKEFWKWVSKELILRPFSHGNGSNPALNLSLFAYSCYKGSTLPYGYNGPANAANLLPINIYYEYIQDILIPAYPEDKILDYSRKFHDTAFSSGTFSTFSSLFSLIRNSIQNPQKMESSVVPETVEVNFEEENYNEEEDED